MKMILIIVGHSGAGKSTVATEFLQIARYNSWDLLTFAKIGKNIANKKGFSRLGEYFEGTDRNVFKRELGEELLGEISVKMKKTEYLVIEGLVYYDIVLSIKNKYKKVLVVNIDVPYEIRIERIAEKLNTTLESARKNEKNKSKLKHTIGIDKVIDCADYILDGRKSVDILVEELARLVDNEWS